MKPLTLRYLTFLPLLFVSYLMSCNFFLFKHCKLNKHFKHKVKTVIKLNCSIIETKIIFQKIITFKNLHHTL